MSRTIFLNFAIALLWAVGAAAVGPSVTFHVMYVNTDGGVAITLPPPPPTSASSSSTAKLINKSLEVKMS